MSKNTNGTPAANPIANRRPGEQQARIASGDASRSPAPTSMCSRYEAMNGTTEDHRVVLGRGRHTRRSDPASRELPARRPERCASTSRYIAATMNSVIVTSVVPKWESRTCMKANARKNAASRAVGVVPDPPGEGKQRDDRQRAGGGRQSAADQKEWLPADWPAGHHVRQRGERPAGGARPGSDRCTTARAATCTSRDSRRTAEAVRTAAPEPSR